MDPATARFALQSTDAHRAGARVRRVLKVDHVGDYRVKKDQQDADDAAADAAKRPAVDGGGGGGGGMAKQVRLHPRGAHSVCVAVAGLRESGEATAAACGHRRLADACVRGARATAVGERGQLVRHAHQRRHGRSRVQAQAAAWRSHRSLRRRRRRPDGEKGRARCWGWPGLDLESSAGWVSLSSRDLWGGAALAILHRLEPEPLGFGKRHLESRQGSSKIGS